MIKKISSVILLLSSLGANASENLFDLSLEQLLEIEVETVSKKSEPLRFAPGIVTVITSTEIEAYGARNIKDILQRLPNLFIFDSSTFTAVGVMMRSGAVQHLNNRVLYLINGRPIRESQNGGVHTDINLMLPIQLIERVEVIRGPGSVLYGSNAFNGTINFITKQASPETAINASVEVGSRGHVTSQVNLTKAFSPNKSIHLSLSRYNDDGETLDYRDENNTLGSKTYFINGQSLFLKAHYDGLSVQFLSSEVTTPTNSGAFIWENKTEFISTRQYVDVGYKHDFNSDWQGTLNLTANKLERDLAERHYLSDGYIVEGQITGQVTPELSFVSGISNDVVKGDLETVGGTYETQRTMLFSQMDYWLSDVTKVTLGAQLNESDHSDTTWSPRFAINHKVNKLVSTKVLYSEAFRSPYGSEMYFDASFLQGNETLISEEIQTVDAQITLSEQDWFTTFTYFHSETKNPIIRTSTGNTIGFDNGNEQVTFQGVEIEAAIHLSQKWEVKGSAVYQGSDSSVSHQDVSYGANMMAKIGLAYQNNEGYQLGLWYSHNGDFNKIENIHSSVVSVNPSASDFGLLSVNLNVDLGKAFNISNIYQPKLSLFVNNLLQETVYYPELGRKIANSIPLPHESGLYLKLSMRF